MFGCYLFNCKCAREGINRKHNLYLFLFNFFIADLRKVMSLTETYF